MSSPNYVPDSDRFTVARKTLLLDRTMNWFIKLGGVVVVAAVFAIFLFIFLQIFPLFGKPDVKRAGSLETPLENAEIAVLGADEWGELPFLLTKDGRLFFADLPRNTHTRAYEIGDDGNLQLGKRGFFEFPTELPKSEWTAFYFDAYTNEILLGSANGEVALLKLGYKAEFPEARPRRIVPEVDVEILPPFGIAGAPVRRAALFDSSESRVVAILQKQGGESVVTLQTYAVKKTLFGSPELSPGAVIDLSVLLDGETAAEVLIGGRGDRLLVVTEGGWLRYFELRDGTLVQIQKLRPFAGEEDPEIASINWLLGKQSAILTSGSGANLTLASYMDQQAGHFVYTPIKYFPDLPGGAASEYSLSQRNRGFLLANEKAISLRYSTTEDIRWETTPGFEPAEVFLGPRWDTVYALDTHARLHLYDVDDPHPNAGFKAFFTDIWYEGKSGPEYEWQSSGGSSDFEPKLSIVPLFFGSIKGTFYAMLFAFPIAVLAAIYTSQFLSPGVKKYVKPAMEIMASLPSVVLGFLAALWLAPILEDRVPSVMLVLVFLPVSAALMGALWGRLPPLLRNRVKPGMEWLVIIPVILVVGSIAWSLGPLFESIAFRAYDPEIGAKVGDFRSWWQEVIGLDYEQRNALIVGVMMGFAVIPIIFTISEDALSNVPPYLRSASLALGASRWQTTWRVILPTASPGIFSATIIGFGRAVGETMIFLMATGNTPIMDWNIFNGMRTLAANIAVELPEAPQHSTLYRTLFLGAMVLFLLTFAINTAAEVTRQHLREKYKTI